MQQKPFNDLRYAYPKPKEPSLFEKLYRLNVFGEERLALGTYKKRGHKYVSGRFEFDMNTCEAWSYGWWQFVKRVGNTIYVNAASYSMQTDVHQSMADNILLCEAPEEYGLKIKYVYYREGLNHLDTAIRNYEYEIKKLREQIAKPKSHPKVNKRREREIRVIDKKIDATKKLYRIIEGHDYGKRSSYVA